MNPSVYLYRKKENKHELYLGEYSTLDGLKAVKHNIEVEILNIGATLYKNHGYATINEFPIWNTVKDIILFFEEEEEFGLIEFEVKLGKMGYLSTHDDGECHFLFNNKKDLINIIKSVSEIKYQQLIISGILNNPNMYIEVNELGKLHKFNSFDDYLEK